MKRCQFPNTVKLNFLQAKHRYEQSLIAKEKENKLNDDSDLDEEDQFLLTHMTALNRPTSDLNGSEMEIDSFHRGLQYDWSSRHTVSPVEQH
jgi:hypothetical protein